MKKNEIIKAYISASAIISTVADIPELAKNSANKVFDAMAAGKPIIINHEGWLAQIIRDEKIGLVLDRNIETSSDKIIELFSNQRRLSAFAQNSRNLGLSRFNVDKQVNKIENIINSASNL